MQPAGRKTHTFQTVERAGEAPAHVAKSVQSATAKPVEYTGSFFSALNSVSPGALAKRAVSWLPFIGARKSTSVAIKQGLIPKMTRSSDAAFAWATDQVVKEGDFPTLLEAIGKLIREDAIVPEMQARQKEIAEQKELFRPRIESERADTEKGRALDTVSQLSRMRPEEGGKGGAYFLYDASDNPRYVVKPNDEDILSLNNRKKVASPLNTPGLRVRYDIPTYESAQNEGLASDIAGLTGLRPIAPLTVMTIIDSEAFHLITDGADPEYVHELIVPDGKEKLCSAQEFVENGEELLEYTSRMSEAGEEVVFDQGDFEMANIFTWISGDQDGHSGNYLAVDNPDGSKGLRKIDNGLICGDGGPRNMGIVNELVLYESQMDRPLSAKGREIIANILLEQIVERMRFFGKSEASINCLSGRVQMLQRLVAENPEITLRSLNEQVEQNYGDRG